MLVRAPQEPEALSKSKTEPWRRSAPKALDHSIAKAVSKVYPKPIDMILDEVINDYGDVNVRTLQYHLRKMIDRGHLLRIDLGRRLYAYLRPGSNMVNDVELMRDQIEAMLVTG